MRNEVIYVKCQNFGCKYVEALSGEIFVLNRKHNDHSGMKDEQTRRLLVEKIRKASITSPDATQLDKTGNSRRVLNIFAQLAVLLS